MAYKGALASDASLPVDGSTVIGTVMIIGSLLCAPALPQRTLDSCVKVLSALESKVDLAPMALLPHARDFILDVDKNKVDLKGLKGMIKTMGIPWTRLG